MNKLLFYILSLNLSGLFAEEIPITGTYGDPCREYRGIILSKENKKTREKEEKKLAEKFLSYTTKGGDPYIFLDVPVDVLNEKELRISLIIWQKFFIKYKIKSQTFLVVNDYEKRIPILYNENLGNAPLQLIVNNWKNIKLVSDEKESTFPTVDSLFSILENKKKEQGILKIKITLNSSAFQLGSTKSMIYFLEKLNTLSRLTPNNEEQEVYYQLIIKTS